MYMTLKYIYKDTKHDADWAEFLEIKYDRKFVPVNQVPEADAVVVQVPGVAEEKKEADRDKCAICLLDLNARDLAIIFPCTCGNGMHIACYNNFIGHNRTNANVLCCPSCRGNLPLNAVSVQVNPMHATAFDHFQPGVEYYHCIPLKGRSNFVAVFDNDKKAYYYTVSKKKTNLRQMHKANFFRRSLGEVNWTGSEDREQAGAKCYGDGCRCLLFY